MSYLDKIFPFYGKLENDEEVYIACDYTPYDETDNIRYGYKSKDGNRRLSFLSYLPLSIPRSNENFNTPNIYPTTNARDRLVSFDLMFTPVSQAASLFKVKNICNNSFELYYNDIPVYISDALIQFDFMQLNYQELTGGKMFTITKSISGSDSNIYKNEYYNYGIFYGIFQLFFNLSPVYKVGCISTKCGCDDKDEDCCISVNNSSLSITDLCNVQTNGFNLPYKILLIPKKSKYISINGEIYNDNTSIYNFIFTWDSIVNNNLQSPYVYYSQSLYKSLEISKKTYSIKYCTNSELCGDNGGCYGSCNVDCISNNSLNCYNITGLSECLDDNDIKDIEKDSNSDNINYFTIITIIFAVLLAISVAVFLIVVFTKSKKQLNIKPTYNVSIYEKESD